MTYRRAGSRADIAKLDKKRPKKGSNKELNPLDMRLHENEERGHGRRIRAEHAAYERGRCRIAVTFRRRWGDTKSLPLR